MNIDTVNALKVFLDSVVRKHPSEDVKLLALYAKQALVTYEVGGMKALKILAKGEDPEESLH